MIAFAARLRPFWPVFAFAASAAMLAAAHGFERFGGLEPCPLCLDQREFHWGVLGVATACFVVLRFRPGWAPLVAAVLGIAFLASAGMGAYHVGVEQHWITAQCDADLDLSQIRPLDAEGSFVAPRCDEVAWSMLGVSMAGYNALISLGLALASFVVAFAPEPKANA